MKLFALLLIIASLYVLAGCETASSNNSPQPNAAKGRGMSPGSEAATSTGVR